MPVQSQEPPFPAPHAGYYGHSRLPVADGRAPPDGSLHRCHPRRGAGIGRSLREPATWREPAGPVHTENVRVGTSLMAALFMWPQSVLVAYAVATMMRCAPAQCPDRYRNASPISWVDPSDTPMLLINSANEAVAASQATEMARALTAARLVARTEIVPGTAHGTAIEPQTWSLAMSWAAPLPRTTGGGGPPAAAPAPLLGRLP